MRPLVAALAFATLLAACGDSTGPGSGVGGTYTLRTIDGRPVPATMLSADAYSFEILSGSLVLGSTGSFEARHRYRETLGTESETYDDVCTGSWSRRGDSGLTFTESRSSVSDCGYTYDGEVRGDTITISYGGEWLAAYVR